MVNKGYYFPTWFALNWKVRKDKVRVEGTKLKRLTSQKKQHTITNSTKPIRVECTWSPKSLRRETCKGRLIIQLHLSSQDSHCIERYWTSYWPHHILSQKRIWHQLEKPVDHRVHLFLKYKMKQQAVLWKAKSAKKSSKVCGGF